MTEVNLGNTQKFNITDNFSLVVAPLPLGKIIELDPQLKQMSQLEKEQDIKKQAEFFINFVYEVVKDLNTSATKEDIKKYCTLQACIKIIQLSMGMIQ